MRCIAIALLSLLLLSGCARQSTEASPSAVAVPGIASPVKVLSASDSLPFDDHGALNLLGVCLSYTARGDPIALSRFDITLPASIDGVSAEVIFPLRVDDGSVMLDRQGASLSPHEQYLVLDQETYGFCNWAARARLVGPGKLGLELAQAQSPPSAKAAPKELRSLALEGVLPFGSDGTFDMAGLTEGGGGASEGANADMNLTTLDLALPMMIDGVEVDVVFPVVVNAETRMFDESGEVVPRPEHMDYEDSDFRDWIASVRKHGDELVAVELRAR